ncbi:hypothetical protein OG689_21510 [Kitasatospora sp. NBC_00240]|uniref:hypothetical protein n=1 Tax=Kitasatospora sp. NBC_00240 TaxID=2903567 RepID=UPI00225C055D|nr:hypothetical protein [Kitasatospora sp. NBC_00240]MCX5211834.1 hypothetical protein [Kitasatospora sp. NBC_00240]
MKLQARVAVPALAVAGLLAALSGCTSGGPAGAASPTLTQPPAGAAPAPSSGRDAMMQLPLGAYGSTDSRSDMTSQAVRALITKCMHAAGYATFTRDDALNEGKRPDSATAMPAGAFGYLSESVAATQGFHPAPETSVPPAHRQLEPAEEQAVQKCVEGSFGQLNSPDTAGSELVGRLYGDSLAALAKDTRVSAATTAWQGCMGAAGFAGVTPQGLVDQYHGGPQAPAGPSPEELAAAKADAVCTSGTNLAGIWFEALAGYQKQLVDANQQKLAEYQVKAKDREAKLAKIIAES